MQTLLIRADAGREMGTGHVMRCLALAQAWRDKGGHCIFAMAGPVGTIGERLRTEKMEIADFATSADMNEDAVQLVNLAASKQASWVVVDGYQFPAYYQQKLKEAGLSVLLIDDNGHAGRYLADLVLDQNANTDESLYRVREPSTRLLLGPRFALLRSEFKHGPRRVRAINQDGRKVLVTMGGSDPKNVTLRVIQALKPVSSKRLQITVVVGGHNSNGESLERAVSGSDIVLARNVANMPDLISETDVAVAAAGSTCWELCFLGVPALLVDAAENQDPVAKALARLGVAVHLSGGANVAAEEIITKLEWLLGSVETRKAMSRNGMALVDGRGAERVVAAMRGRDLVLRRVRDNDCRTLWEWANDEDVRAASFSPGHIAWNDHVAWFNQRVNDARVLMLIATDKEGVPIGQIRFERTKDDEAEISVSIVGSKRGQGLAPTLIDRSVETAFHEMDLACVHAFVRPENQASARAFENADFKPVGLKQVRANTALHYLRRRNHDENETRQQ